VQLAPGVNVAALQGSSFAGGANNVAGFIAAENDF